jgi:hypothetical protein
MKLIKLKCYPYSAFIVGFTPYPRSLPSAVKGMQDKLLCANPWLRRYLGTTNVTKSL